MDNITTQMLSLLEAVSVDVLVKDKGVNVVIIDAAGLSPDISAEDLPDIYRAIRILTCRGQTIAMAIGKTLHVKPEFYKGGKYHNVFIDNEIKLMLKTYTLDRAIAVNFKEHQTDLFIELEAIAHQSEIEKDPERFYTIVERAKALATELNHADATRLQVEIFNNYKTFQEESSPDQEKLKDELRTIVEQMKLATADNDLKVVSALATKGAALGKLITEGDQETQQLGLYINQTILNLRSVPATESDQDTEADEDPKAANQKAEEAEFLEFMAQGEKAFNAKKWKPAKHAFEKALKLRPKRNAPKEYLQQIAELERLGK